MRRQSPPKASPGRVAGAKRAGHLGTRYLTDEVGEQLSGWGTVLKLETRGRRSGATVTVAVGYIEAPDGSLLVAAGDADADWARNLEADPRATATIGARTVEVTAEPLEGREAADAVVALILRYGTSAERLGRGPAFRLSPIEGA